MPPFVAGEGPFEPDLMIIGEAPGVNESAAGRPFVGPTGAMLEDMLRVAGVRREECYITNVVKYQPPFNDLTKLHLIDVDIEKSVEELWENEIRVFKPKCILAVGNLALEATTGLTGILDRRGSILSGRDGIKVIPTIHPAALFSKYEKGGKSKGGLNYAYRTLIQFDIKRAVEESKTSDIIVPHRQLDIARNSLDLYRFFQNYADRDKATCDIESINCVTVCVGFAFNNYHAISVPLIQGIGKNKLTNMSLAELGECWKMIDVELRRLKLVGHNFKYDDFKLGLSGFRCLNVHSDTLIKTRVIFPELPDKSLGTCASIWTREPFYKHEGKEFKLNQSNADKFLLYNGRDCAVNYEVDEEQDKELIELSEKYDVPLWDYYYNYQMKKHKFYLEMENVGFAVDHARKKELKQKYTEMQRVAHEKLTALIGREVNVKSPPQVFELLYREMGFPTRKIAPTSEDSIVALMLTHCKGKNGAKKQEILETLLEERRIRDQKSRYINFTPDYDGRCKTSFNIIRTETCRSSTSVLDKPVRPQRMGLAFHTISKHGRLAKDIRSMFIPDKGKVFLQADSGQAEARVVAVLARDYELLRAFDTVDIHRRTAGLIFGMSSELILTEGYVPLIDDIAKDDPLRHGGKTTRHAGNYDMKKKRFKQEFDTSAQKAEINMSISEWKAGDMLERFHGASPKIRGIFHAEIKEAIDEARLLIDPFGGVRIFHGRMDDSLYQEAYANIPQRTVAYLVQGAGLKVEEELNGDIEYVFVSENHDSLLLQVPENNWEPYARLLKKHMECPIDFSKYCTLKRDYMLTIPCAIEIATENYAKMKDVKLASI